MNKHILLIISLAFITGLVLSACQSGGSEGGSPLNTLTAEEKEQGFVLLFDGKTFDGWRGYHKEAFPEQGWIIEDGALKCVGSGEGEAGGGGGDIIYEKRFKDFHLKLEWKISPAGNSGIFYLAEELDGEPIWKSSPEMQVLCNEGHLDAQLGKDGNRQAGALYDLIPAVPGMLLAPEQDAVMQEELLAAVRGEQ